MPPALHPRSRWTSSLFTSTLIVSFLVVGAPHILPCPAPRKVAADSRESLDPSKRRRRKRRDTEESAGMAPEKKEVPADRECPVPKPSGFVGQLLGFKEPAEKKERPILKIETVKARERRKAIEEKPADSR